MMIEFYDKSAEQRGYIEMHIVNPNMLRWYPGADRKINKGKAYMQFERTTIEQLNFHSLTYNGGNDAFGGFVGGGVPRVCGLDAVVQRRPRDGRAD
jgi:hypothetical protein